MKAPVSLYVDPNPVAPMGKGIPIQSLMEQVACQMCIHWISRRFPAGTDTLWIIGVSLLEKIRKLSVKP